MEVVSVLNRSIRTMPTRSVLLGKHVTTAGGRLNLTSTSIRQRFRRIESRNLTYTARQRRDAPAQPRSVSQAEHPLVDTIGESQQSQSQSRPRSDQQQQYRQRQRRESQDTTGPTPDPNNRIDLSPLANALKNRQASASTSTGTRTSASAKLDDLFGKPRRDPTTAAAATENPFQRAIRQTDALDGIVNPYQRKEILEINGLFDDINLNSPSLSTPPDARTQLPLRLRPTLGRTQPVDSGRGMDLTRAFRTLEIKCSNNGVKRDSNQQRFHVRRGQRRKLERSLRWRAVFKTGFLEECARVRRMKNQGW